jgi:dihydrodipicolinate synthase/N-acetylneuraminate lyase
MSLITELTKFYEAWRKNDIENAGIVWRKLTSLSDAMSLYYIPIKYIDHQPGIDCPDAFTRTQLRQILERCRYFIDFV